MDLDLDLDLDLDWIRGHKIGQGSSSATVSIARARLSNQTFAVKSVALSESGGLRREETILSSLNCPQIVGYIGSDVTAAEIGNGEFMYNLLMEYAPGGSLGGARLVDQEAIASYTRDVLVGLDYIHGNGLVHCDIKGANVLITPQGAKIADFGCAKWLVDPSFNIAGTPLFMAPEVARGEQQTCSADVWALGCTVIEMATGSPPWMDAKAKDPVSALHRIGFSSDVPQTPSFLSDQAKDFLGKCLVRDPKQRWSANQLLKHPFVQVPKQNQDCFSLSPTSILDEELWKSIDNDSSETPPNLSNTATSSPSSSYTSAVERLGRICSRRAPTNWELDDGWITITSNSATTMATATLDRVLTGSKLDKMDLSNSCTSCFGDFCRLDHQNCEKHRRSVSFNENSLPI